MNTVGCVNLMHADVENLDVSGDNGSQGEEVFFETPLFPLQLTNAKLANSVSHRFLDSEYRGLYSVNVG